MVKLSKGCTPAIAGTHTYVPEPPYDLLQHFEVIDINGFQSSLFFIDNISRTYLE